MELMLNLLYEETFLPQILSNASFKVFPGSYPLEHRDRPAIFITRPIPEPPSRRKPHRCSHAESNLPAFIKDKLSGTCTALV